MPRPAGARRVGATICTVAGALLLLGGASAVGAALGSQTAPPPVHVSPAPALAPVGGPVMARSRPVQLDIASIGVHARLLDVGLNPDGTLEVPPPGPTYDLPAWYRNSPTPGELGPSVVEGHLDSVNGPSVFYRLGELKPGDQIEVRREDGRIAVFRVTHSQVTSKTAFPTADVYGDVSHAALRLITCWGPIDAATGHYRDNVIVYAVLAGSRAA